MALLYDSIALFPGAQTNRGSRFQFASNNKRKMSSADVGLLFAFEGRRRNDGVAGGVNDNSSGDSYAVPAPTRLHDVYTSLSRANSGIGRCTGGFCASGRADGTALAPSLPAAPGLQVFGIGNVSLPITDTTTMSTALTLQ